MVERQYEETEGYNTGINDRYLYLKFNLIYKKKVKGTDYAKCQWLYVNPFLYSYWWLRSPNVGNANYAQSVPNGGSFSGSRYDVFINGVRPACYINL